MVTIFSPVALTIAVTAWSFREKIAPCENSGKFLKIFEKSKYQTFLKTIFRILFIYGEYFVYQLNYVYRFFVSFFFSYAIKFAP